MATNEPKPFLDITTTDLSLDYDVGPRATFLLMQAVHPVMAAAGGGSIVNFGSGSGTGGAVGWGGYAGAKEAIRGLSKVAALEWGKDNIRVNTVCPFAESDAVKLWKESSPPTTTPRPSTMCPFNGSGIPAPMSAPWLPFCSAATLRSSPHRPSTSMVDRGASADTLEAKPTVRRADGRRRRVLAREAACTDSRRHPSCRLSAVRRTWL